MLNLLQPGTLPAYAGLTIGGIITSGAHGTGDMTISYIVSQSFMSHAQSS